MTDRARLVAMWLVPAAALCLCLAPTASAQRFRGNKEAKQRPAVLPAVRKGKAPAPPKGAVREPGSPAAPEPAKQQEKVTTGIEDVITFKTNFEKDVKCVPLPLNARVNVDFQDASIEDVLKFMACILRRNFIITQGLQKGKTITIMATRPVTVYEAYKAFLSAMAASGVTLVPSGPFYQLVPTNQAKQMPLPLYGAHEKVPAEDRLMTRIVILENIDVQEIEPILDKFKTPMGDITSYKPGNSLIVTDLGSNVGRILKFVRELDVPIGRERIWVRPVQYASSADMANLITALFMERSSGAGRPVRGGRPVRRGAQRPVLKGQAHAGGTVARVTKVVADERTNSLIIVATPAAYMRIDKLLRKVDVPVEGEGQVHIYYLENADAEEVAKTLSSLTSGAQGGRAARGRHGRGTTAAAAASLFEGQVRITAHKPTNALVIEASLKDYLALRRVIQQLDVRRKQVYVEAVIMEISSNKDRKVGLSGSGGLVLNIGGDKVPLLFGLGGLGMSAFDLQQLSKGGIAIGMQGPLVDVSTGTTGQAQTSGVLAIPSYGFLIQALQSTSDVNVLSTPHILTMDNEEAEIVVGKQIPYQATTLGGLSSLFGLGAFGGLTGQTGTTTTTGTTTGLSSYLPYLGGLGYGGYVQRIDVDLKLKIKPQISESNYVRLEIEQSVDDVESMDPTLGPTTSKRRVKNVVMVRDQQPVVIGGLMRDVEVTGVDKVPILGDIPLFGLLFRKSAKRIEKRNLLMVITPYIIEDPSDLARIKKEKMEEMREFAEYMATRKREFEWGIDYRKKTGILEDIRRSVEKQKKEQEMLQKSLIKDVDIVGPPETHDIDYDPFEGQKKGRSDTNMEGKQEKGEKAKGQ